jgi:hypothetical protein
MIMDQETTLLKRFMYFQMHVHKWCTLEAFCKISKFSVLPEQQDCNPELFSHYLFKKQIQFYIASSEPLFRTAYMIIQRNVGQWEYG